jgi:hypothetical protein
VIAPRVPAALFCAVVAACNDATGPGEFIGYYPLRAVNGAPLPSTVPAAGQGCTLTFSGGSLTLADGAFYLTTFDALGCPGYATSVGSTSIGGALAVRGGVLYLRAIDPTSPTAEVFDATVVIRGPDAALTLPGGALALAESTTLVFGPRRASVASQRASP